MTERVSGIFYEGLFLDAYVADDSVDRLTGEVKKGATYAQLELHIPQAVGFKTEIITVKSKKINYQDLMKYKDKVIKTQLRPYAFVPSDGGNVLTGYSFVSDKIEVINPPSTSETSVSSGIMKR